MDGRKIWKKARQLLCASKLVRNQGHILPLSSGMELRLAKLV
jgi:hypothetical protein